MIWLFIQKACRYEQSLYYLLMEKQIGILSETDILSLLFRSDPIFVLERGDGRRERRATPL
jgi:hypothetical protein